MKAMHGMKWVLILGIFALVAACAGVAATGSQTEERHDVLYTCNCGPQCKCNNLSTKPGKCACGAQMKWGHVIKVEGSEALLCQCAEGCKCAIDPKDASKCGCGTPVKRVSLAGYGIYFCNCGGSCFCNTVSASPTKCGCGMELKKID